MNYSIAVKDLSKQYRIGKLNSKTTFREALVDLVRYPLRRQGMNDTTIWALKDVSFDIKEGEVVGIIGRNGAGKSTLLKVISKITRPTSGKIKAHGRIGSLLEVGTGFHEELTGRENIFLNGSILGMTKKEIHSKMDQIVAFADVEKFIDTPIKRYSSGMKLRLGFAVAAHLDTNILLVDEVLAVGDAGFQKKCINKIGNLREGGRTILFVSHNMAAVENLCSRAIWIDNGQVRQDGDPKEVIFAYMSSFSEIEKTGADLREVSGRRGSGEIRFMGIEFLDSDRQPLNLIRSGDRLIVRLHYRVEKRVSNIINFGIRIFTELGTLVADFSTINTGTVISEMEPGEEYIEADIDFLNLMPSRYYMSLSVYNVGYEIYDGLENCAAFDVEESDFYKTGKGINSSNGIVFFPYRWFRGSPAHDGLPVKENERQSDVKLS